MQVKTKSKPKPLVLGIPPNIPAPREPTPPTRPIGELDTLAANFQYLSDRVGDVTIYNDLPPNAHEFLTRTQLAINNLRGYTRQIKDRDLKEYREALASQQIGIVCKVSFVGLMTVFLCGLVTSFQTKEVYVQPVQNSYQSGVPLGSPNSSQLYPP
jgi:hypothetical protein